VSRYRQRRRDKGRETKARWGLRRGTVHGKDGPPIADMSWDLQPGPPRVGVEHEDDDEEGHEDEEDGS
jgi:hypothetical protein